MSILSVSTGSDKALGCPGGRGGQVSGLGWWLESMWGWITGSVLYYRHPSTGSRADLPAHRICPWEGQSGFFSILHLEETKCHQARSTFFSFCISFANQRLKCTCGGQEEKSNSLYCSVTLCRANFFSG